MASPNRHYTLTLTGFVQQIPIPSGTDGRVRWFSLQPGEANANPVYIGDGDTDTLSSTDYGTRLPASTAGVPPPPHIIGEFEDGAVNPNHTYVIGSNGEKLHIHYCMVGATATLLRRGGGGA